MEETQLGGHESIVIREIDLPSVCEVTEEGLDVNGHAVLCQTTETEGDHGVFHISIGAVDELHEALERATFTSSSEGVGSIRFVPKDTDTYTLYRECVACGENVDLSQPHVQANSHAIYAWACLHEECVDEFCDALEDVWEYSERLLAEKV